MNLQNAQKFSLQSSLGSIAKKGAQNEIAHLGKSLPASVVAVQGAIVTIKFEVLSKYNMPTIDVPLATSQYAREPIQVGDKGYVIASDVDISGVCGQTTNTADLINPGNLSALVFHPIGNKNWKSVDPLMYVITGLSDVMLRDDIHQLQLENEYASWNLLIQQLNALLLIIGPLLTTPTVLTPLNSATLNPVQQRA